MRLLFVEDSKRLQESVCGGLRRMGYAVDSAEDGIEGLWLAESNAYDVIILDLMLPKLDGLGLLRRLREAGRNDHVLILTAKDAVADRVAGLDAGADDYLGKPFEFPELLARVRALGRRTYQAKTPKLALGDGLLLDTVLREVVRDGAPLPLALTRREYTLLELLALRRGTPVTRTEIEHRIYDERAEPMSNVVEVAVCGLRRKIDAPGAPSRIQTVRGTGYLLRVPAGPAEDGS